MDFLGLPGEIDEMFFPGTDVLRDPFCQRWGKGNGSGIGGGLAVDGAPELLCMVGEHAVCGEQAFELGEAGAE